ncbi:hypothetical protein SVIO_025200 [Streptomyces violaceusniger]|uniref:Uncharacterized protein n=1 Tax=Streptomyces violaceusniger TaxID=68280 RepID=A0A4D4KZG7_STRVO|nr:hypothetical protein SVIO_025200 [Streptomyces violaceusniger]
MAERHRIALQERRLAEQSGNEVDVGETHTSRFHLDQDFSGTGSWPADLFDPQLEARDMQARRAHDCHRGFLSVL